MNSISFIISTKRKHKRFTQFIARFLRTMFAQIWKFHWIWLLCLAMVYDKCAMNFNVCKSKHFNITPGFTARAYKMLMQCAWLSNDDDGQYFFNAFTVYFRMIMYFLWGFFLSPLLFVLHTEIFAFFDNDSRNYSQFVNSKIRLQLKLYYTQHKLNQ